MELNNLKKILELLLIKKSAYIIKKDEEDLLNEINFLLKLANSYNLDKLKTECNCEINQDTLEKEIYVNQCLDCGLPLSIL